MAVADGPVTAEAIAAGLEPDARPGRTMSRVGGALTKMVRLGYIRRVSPASQLWDVGEVGLLVMARLALDLAKPRTARRYRTYPDHRRASKARRDAAREQERCVNENSRGTHGPATHGCRCHACDVTHRRSA